MILRMTLWQSKKSIENELARLRAQSDALARSLSAQCARLDQLTGALRPLSRRIVALENTLRKLTPYAELVARRTALQQKLDSCPSSNSTERIELAHRLSVLDSHLRMRRKPLSLKSAVLFILTVIALVWLKHLIVA
ncbi:MAG: hypothetical protein CVV14_13015 [Gammaproteobacteria bacterium HGW-Gammaproteobacteria-4]|jgi:chromosome segregation ATPase|nr:MAG: hypothetical protein CVV14_13015 [Gammaproteobacteria bacterium HGW-Gammaproteobacteria-4]